MTELDALRWVQDTPGMKIYIGHERRVTLSMQNQIEVTGKGLLGAVVKCQKVLREMKCTGC